MGRLVLLLASLLLLSVAAGFIGSVPSELEEQDSVANSGSGQWTMTDGPSPQAGWSATMWQPDPKGTIWEIDFSPDGERIAAVDISDSRLYVWDASDGRVLLWIGHSKTIVDVVWLSNDWVLVADGETGWYSYEVIDDGSSLPRTSTQMRYGSWSDSMTGTYNGWLWGLDASVNHSKVAFCGDLDHMSMGGEVVIADLDHFIDGSSHNARHFLPQHWSVDCDISPNGTMISVLGRNMTVHPDGNVTYRDHVYGINADTGALYWDRLVAGPNSSAWAIDWEPGGVGYTIAYNHPTPGQPGQWEGVASLYDPDSGSVQWYSPIPQNVSSLRWLSDGYFLCVGLYDPGRISFIDSGGNIQTDKGWHSVITGSTGLPEDITAVASVARPNDGTANQWIASSGKDGSIEIWSVDNTKFEIEPVRRLGPHTVREISVEPTQDLVAVAESSGTVTIREGQNGSIITQCFHPEYGQLAFSIPNTKSVAWGSGWVASGFSDGVVIGCNMNGKWSWQFDLRNHRNVSSFGRVAVHPTGQFIAISWSENSTDPTKDGKVAIVDPFSQQILQEWSYAETHWTLSFNEFGERLASVSQSGDVRLWNTSHPDPANWVDDGSPYSHQGYVGVCQWMPGAPDVLITAGWDKQLYFYDVLGQIQGQHLTLLDEAFSLSFKVSMGLFQGMFAVGTGNASTSTSGQVEFFDMINGNLSRVGAYGITNIPRGVAFLPTDGTPIVVNHTGSLMNLKQDADGDGWLDSEDAFPFDPTQHEDSDQDGWGDDSSQENGDACPTTGGTSTEDRLGCPDTDGDGYSDPDSGWPAHPAGSADAFVDNNAQWRDTDGDGHGDNYTFQLEGDGLRGAESGDAFVSDPEQHRDRDGDGCGDNYSFLLDAGLRINERGDAFPTDATQCNDFDGDGYGDNYSYEIGVDGLRVENGDAFTDDYLAWSDLDGDGCPTDSATGLEIDLHPTNPDTCSEETPFAVPQDMAVTISNDATRWYVNVSWSSADSNTLQILLNTAQTDASGTTASGDGDYVTRQVWTTVGAVDESILVDRAAANSDRLHVLIRVVPSSGDSIEQTWSALWIEPTTDSGEPPDNGSSNQTTENETSDPDTDGDGVLDSADNCPNESGPPENQGCPVVVDDGTGGTDDDGEDITGHQSPSNDEADSSSIPMIAIIAGVIVAILAILLFMRRHNRGTTQVVKDTFSMSQPSTSLPPESKYHAPCKVCGGPVQEVAHQGNLWTWCPTCRAWLDFLGKN